MNIPCLYRKILHNVKITYQSREQDGNDGNDGNDGKRKMLCQAKRIKVKLNKIVAIKDKGYKTAQRNMILNTNYLMT